MISVWHMTAIKEASNFISGIFVGFTIPGTPGYGIIILRDNFSGKNRFRR